jgi:hypothetical protein
VRALAVGPPPSASRAHRPRRSTRRHVTARIMAMTITALLPIFALLGLLVAGCCSDAAAAAVMSSGNIAAATTTTTTGGPCDIFSQGGTPCVAAHSVVRALFGAYAGPLYQVLRTTDGKSLNVTTISAGGYADGAAQAAFCDNQPTNPPGPPPPPARWAPGPCCTKRLTCINHSNPLHPTCVGCAECPAPTREPTLATCMITRIFDQSVHANHLHVIGEPSGLVAVGAGGRLHNGAPITGTNASADPLFVGGHAVYSAYFEGGMGFRNNETNSVATGGTLWSPPRRRSSAFAASRVCARL